jgi:hypothetical protein
MTDRDRAELRALCDQFRRAMASENDVLLYDQDAKPRIGEMIGSAVRRGGSEFGYLRRRG